MDGTRYREKKINWNYYDETDYPLLVFRGATRLRLVGAAAVELMSTALTESATTAAALAAFAAAFSAALSSFFFLAATFRLSLRLPPQQSLWVS